MKINKMIVMVVVVCLGISCFTACDDKKESISGDATAYNSSSKDNSKEIETTKSQGDNTSKSQEEKSVNKSQETKLTQDNSESQNTKMRNQKYVVAIDAGHQAKQNSAKEPIGPGASTMKAKVTSGTAGVATRIPEYKLTLQIAQKLKDSLETKGYKVIMVRNSHDVNISNKERAQVANDAKADAFIRIHANGSENSSVNGAMTICQTASSPYNANLHSKSKLLSTCVLDSFVKATNCKREKVWETDTMSGINWCNVPVTIIEMGYMSNPNEDKLMNSEDYQSKMVAGMVNGIETYFEKIK